MKLKVALCILACLSFFQLFAADTGYNPKRIPGTTYPEQKKWDFYFTGDIFPLNSADVTPSKKVHSRCCLGDSQKISQAHNHEKKQMALWVKLLMVSIAILVASLIVTIFEFTFVVYAAVLAAIGWVLFGIGTILTILFLILGLTNVI